MNAIVGHFIAASLAILLAVVFYFNSLSLPPAAYELPRLLIAVIILLSILMLGEAIVEDRKKKREEASQSQEHPGGLSVNYTRAFVFALLIALYVFSIKPLGYFIVTPLYIIATYLFLKATRLTNILLISLGFTAFVYIVFVYLLKVPIPLGPIQ